MEMSRRAGRAILDVASAPFHRAVADVEMDILSQVDTCRRAQGRAGAI